MSGGQRSKGKGQSTRLALLFLVAACAEHSQPSQLEPPAVRPDAVVAYLTASPGSTPNEYVVRAVAKRGVAVEDPGSFVAAVRFPSRTVSFIADASTGDAARAIAPTGGAIRVAGAAPEGLKSGELFAVRLRASRASDINGLVLEISELNDRSGISLRPKLALLQHVSWIGRP
jgi:hypothetical protein